jgi:hypothetical protein
LAYFCKNWRFCEKYLKIGVLQKSVFLQKIRILHISANLRKSAFLAKNTYKLAFLARFFCENQRFCKNQCFAKISGFFAKIGVFAKNT